MKQELVSSGISKKTKTVKGETMEDVSVYYMYSMYVYWSSCTVREHCLYCLCMYNVWSSSVREIYCTCMLATNLGVFR